MTALQSNDTGVRISACHALGAFRQEPESSISLLIKLAQDDMDEYVRSAALHAAAAFGAAGLPFCGAMRAEVEKAIQERAEEDRLWGRATAK